jgi:YfiH family protein
VYAFRTSAGPVDLAFTDRYGGVSAAPFDELNLSISGADDDTAKAENHRVLLGDFAPADGLADVYQVHGADVVDAEPGVRPEADGIVTNRTGITLMVRAADCVPVLLADPAAGVIGAAHAGRKGMAAGVAVRTVQRMQELGATSIAAWIGPSICGLCYEVPAQMRDEVAAIEPTSAATTRQGTPAIDVAEGVRAQLERIGVQVHHVGDCTFESHDLYSYRRDGDSAGRLAGVIRIRP